MNRPEPVASSVIVPMGVQVTKSCEERTLYVWPGWPVPLKVMGAPAEAQIWSVGGITEKGWMRYMPIGRLVPAGSVKVTEPLASGVTVPITVQTLRSCEARTLYVWPAWPVPFKVNDPPGTLWIWRAIGGILFVGEGTV